MRNPFAAAALASLAALAGVPAVATPFPDALVASRAWAPLEEPAAALTLDDVQALAMRGSPALAAAAGELAATRAEARQARRWPNPELAVQVEDLRRSTRTSSAVLQQPIPLPGRRGALADAADGAGEAAEAAFAAARVAVRAEVTGAFFETLVAQERERLAGDAAGLAERAASVARRRVKAGQVAPVEEVRAQVARATAVAEQGLAARALRTARIRLAACWGNPLPRFQRVEGELRLPEALDRPRLEARIEAAPAVWRLAAEAERQRALAELERSRPMPGPVLSLGVQRDEALGRNQAIVGVAVPLPVFDRNDDALVAALARADQAQDAVLAARMRLASEALQAAERLDAARDEATLLAEDALPGAEWALAAATRGFEQGKFDFLLVLDAQRTLFQVRMQYLDALARAHRARSELDAVIGDPAGGDRLAAPVR